jgi:NAD-dependent deacetylase
MTEPSVDPETEAFTLPEASEHDVKKARILLQDAQRIVVLTGAGISTDSGIPDFRGPNGIWTKDREAEKLATIDVYLSRPDIRRKAWRRRIDTGVFEREPNAGHRALVDLERTGRLDLVITQNIDGLHRAAGTAPERLAEVHGNVREIECVACDARFSIAETIARVEAGEDDPPCTVCGGILKPTVVFFGESLPADDVERAFEAAGECDLFFAVGTTLSVYPIAETVPVALRNQARLIILNAEPTPFDLYADVVLRASISDTLPRLVV